MGHSINEAWSILHFARSAHARIVTGCSAAMSARKGLRTLLVAVDLIAVKWVAVKLALMATVTLTVTLLLAASVNGLEMIGFCRSC